MSAKEIFRPTKAKILIVFLFILCTLLVYGPIYHYCHPSVTYIYSGVIGGSIFGCNILSPLSELINPLHYGFSTNPLIILIIQIVYYYTVACLLVFVYSKIKERGLQKLSIGIVVLVVLSFGMIWEQSIPPGSPPITSERAKMQLIGDITSGKMDMCITLPFLSALPTGASQEFEILLKNKEFNPRCYMFDIELVNVNAGVSSSYFNRPDCISSSCPSFSEMKQDAEEWFNITSNVLLAEPQQIISAMVSLNIADSAKEGRYGFTAYAYFMDPEIAPEECKLDINESRIDSDRAPKASSFQIGVIA